MVSEQLDASSAELTSGEAVAERGADIGVADRAVAVAIVNIGESGTASVPSMLSVRVGSRGEAVAEVAALRCAERGSPRQGGTAAGSGTGAASSAICCCEGCLSKTNGGAA
mmetsp:Transcript_30599/g.95591  ORF Transcript_30599/g.95591 Transcript_30599/m.95591 type:complete len:111 (+) Transcript_30599:2491-2823(+)